MIETIKKARVLLSRDKTNHSTGGEEVKYIASVAISKYDSEDGYYLFYFDNEGNELTDTFHDTIDAAINQAEFEFILADWE